MRQGVGTEYDTGHIFYPGQSWAVYYAADDLMRLIIFEANNRDSTMERLSRLLIGWNVASRVRTMSNRTDCANARRSGGTPGVPFTFTTLNIRLPNIEPLSVTSKSVCLSSSTSYTHSCVDLTLQSVCRHCRFVAHVVVRFGPVVQRARSDRLWGCSMCLL